MDAQLIQKSKKGIISGAVVGAIGAAITLFIGIWVISSVTSGISQVGWTTEANETYAQVQSTTWQAIVLLSVGLIVMAAGVILSYFTMGRRR